MRKNGLKVDSIMFHINGAIKNYQNSQGYTHEKQFRGLGLKIQSILDRPMIDLVEFLRDLPKGAIHKHILSVAETHTIQISDFLNDKIKTNHIVFTHEIDYRTKSIDLINESFIVIEPKNIEQFIKNFREYQQEYSQELGKLNTPRKVRDVMEAVTQREAAAQGLFSSKIHPEDQSGEAQPSMVKEVENKSEAEAEAEAQGFTLL